MARRTRRSLLFRSAVLLAKRPTDAQHPHHLFIIVNGQLSHGFSAGDAASDDTDPRPNGGRRHSRRRSDRP